MGSLGEVFGWLANVPGLGLVLLVVLSGFAFQAVWWICWAGWVMLRGVLGELGLLPR